MIKMGCNNPSWAPILYNIAENFNLSETKCENDLGVNVDSALNSSNHTTAQVNKANKILGLIRRSYVQLDKMSFKHLFKCDLDMYSMKYRFKRADMTQYFKILHNYYDFRVNKPFQLNRDSITRAHNMKMRITSVFVLGEIHNFAKWLILHLSMILWPVSTSRSH